MVVNACDCAKCAGACAHKPGWFKPEQIAPLAEALGLTEQELFDRHLQVDWWENDEIDGPDEIFVLSPAVTEGEPGDMFDGDPRGACRWLQDGKCAIHQLGKPFECAAYHHADTEEAVSQRHEETAQAWTGEQDRIRKLLGREPEASAFFNPFGLFGSLF
jgi:hypothetical protein